MNRLVQVEPYYSPPYIGGTEMRARERAEWLAASGWAVETLTSAGRTYPHAVADGKVSVRYLRSFEIAHTPIILALPIALMKTPRDSVVQVESAVVYSPEITAAVCRLRRMPYVMRVTLDSAGHGKLRSALLRAHQRTILRWVYRHACRVIVLTPDDITLVTEKYRVDPDRVSVIPNATTFVLAESARAKPHDPFRLLFVGRVELQKNLPLLLRSLRRLIDSSPRPVHLDIAGEGEEMPLVRGMITELALHRHVSLKGFVTGDQLEALYEVSDALVLTSTRETFGQVILEAMTKAMPVVASNVRCVRTIVTDGASGLLAELDEESFAAALLRLVSDDDLYAKLSSGALEQAKFYSVAATLSLYMRTYEEVFACRSGRGIVTHQA